ncbi:MAG: diacylglycerol kinase family protein, partial [Propionibacteriaceae bacterium]|nr:diacylglycerol kinase family protein [Propionibacteriaceae bacterium]
MPTSRPSRFSVWITVGLAVAFAGWTWLVTAGVLDAFDRTTVAPGLTESSVGAEIWSAIAILTWPGVPYLALFIVGFWAFRRRLRNLAYAQWLAIVIGWGSHILVKAIIARPRPTAALNLVTAHGWAYPSGHVTTATVVAAMLIAAVLVTRQSRSARWLAWGLGTAGVLLVAVCRWVLQAHWVSDLVGGLLLGSFVAAGCLVVARVHVLPDKPWELANPRPVPSTGKRCVVIFNPTKVVDVTTFRRHVEYELRNRGWEPPLWLETTRNDPGYRMSALAVKQGADLVLTAGGDGTIRAVCEGLAGSGIPLALLPAGTGNL